MTYGLVYSGYCAKSVEDLVRESSQRFSPVLLDGRKTDSFEFRYPPGNQRYRGVVSPLFEPRGIDNFVIAARGPGIVGTVIVMHEIAHNLRVKTRFNHELTEIYVRHINSTDN